MEKIMEIMERFYYLIDMKDVITAIKKLIIYKVMTISLFHYSSLFIQLSQGKKVYHFTFFIALQPYGNYKLLNSQS